MRIILTIYYTGYFGTRCNRVFKTIPRQFSKLFWAQGGKCIHLTKSALRLYQTKQGFKVCGGGCIIVSPPCNVGLNGCDISDKSISLVLNQMDNDRIVKDRSTYPKKENLQFSLIFIQSPLCVL